MKKIVSISGVLFGAIILTGCGQSTVNQTQPTKPSVEVQKVNQQKKDVSAPANNNDDALKIYQNDKFGFSLNYLGSYKINETDWENEPQPGGNIYLLQLGDDSVVDFDVDYNKGILVYVAKLEKDLANGSDPLAAPNGMDPVSTKDIMLDGQKAKNYNDGQAYAVAKGGYEYLLVLGEQANQATKDDFIKIVNSFKFTR